MTTARELLGQEMGDNLDPSKSDVMQAAERVIDRLLDEKRELYITQDLATLNNVNRLQKRVEELEEANAKLRERIGSYADRVEELEQERECKPNYPENCSRERRRERLDRMVAALTFQGNTGYYAERVAAAKSLLAAIDKEVDG